LSYIDRASITPFGATARSALAVSIPHFQVQLQPDGQAHRLLAVRRLADASPVVATFQEREQAFPRLGIIAADGA
jgi:hypothetical protein